MPGGQRGLLPLQRDASAAPIQRLGSSLHRRYIVSPVGFQQRPYALGKGPRSVRLGVKAWARSPIRNGCCVVYSCTPSRLFLSAPLGDASRRGGTEGCWPSRLFLAAMLSEAKRRCSTPVASIPSSEMWPEDSDGGRRFPQFNPLIPLSVTHTTLRQAADEECMQAQVWPGSPTYPLNPLSLELAVGGGCAGSPSMSECRSWASSTTTPPIRCVP